MNNKQKREVMKWHSWFAWFPILLDGETNNTWRFTWLVTVQRRLRFDNYTWFEHNKLIEWWEYKDL